MRAELQSEERNGCLATESPNPKADMTQQQQIRSLAPCANNPCPGSFQVNNLATLYPTTRLTAPRSHTASNNQIIKTLQAIQGT